MNRRGQEAKYLTGIPALILIVLFGGILIGISLFLAGIRGTGEIIAERGTESSIGVLFEPIQVGGQEMLVLDALLAHDADRIEKENFEEGLSALLDAERTCLLLALGQNAQPGGQSGGAALNDIYLRYEEGNVRGSHIGAFPTLFAPYRKANMLSGSNVLLHDGNRMYVEYYHGRCLG